MYDLVVNVSNIRWVITRQNHIRSCHAMSAATNLEEGKW